MALGTMGTTSNSGLVSMIWNPMSPVADVAAIAAHIKGQSGPQNISPGSFSYSGRLHFPGRLGFILLKPGDYIGYDNWNWPIIVSKESIASGSSWTHSQ